MNDFTCPLVRIVTDWADDEHEHGLIGVPVDCGALLHLTWAIGWPLDATPDPTGLARPAVTREDIARAGYSDSWEIVCENGHTVASSTMDGGGGDYAEPCDVERIMAAIGAGRSSDA